ncbi:uncharacterized protein LOC110737647 isoform X2 [Chenopodium quinoa]|uniref:uncharacterized protein LOC110737647 isoform X1 n=1 Tax=Chenopodium quinoa TaxID=63459 RepID=UPI000B76D7BC|nr:uncharacterized protein LOC110737647 isoform X1 [Chenopodium quinoa]XP_021773670.1 uncharacterized protein LOC110737647 isoform X2 [Chenopodium quinoa]
MATIQLCKPAQVSCDQTKNLKTGQNNEKKLHFHFWQKHGNEKKNEQATNKHQNDVGHPNYKHVTFEHKNEHGQAANKPCHDVGHPTQGNTEVKVVHGQAQGQAANNKQHHEVTTSNPRSHKLRQCFGHGAAGLADSDVDEETETIVIERKIKERVVISHVKKCHDHKEGSKHLDRC